MTNIKTAAPNPHDLGKPTRGERNNNPTNIEKSDIDWLGKVEGDDPDFETFSSPLFGIRAAARDLLESQIRHHRRTIAELVTAWAPPTNAKGETINDTAAYIRHVAGVLGVAPGDAYNVQDPAKLQALLWALIDHENGRVIYGDDLIAEAVRRAMPQETEATVSA